MIFAGVFAALFVLGLCFAFFFGAYSFLSGGHEAWIAFLYWGVFLFWQLVPIFTAGFGAGFEFRTLLRFPLSLRAFYVIGLAYGLSDFAAVASSCWLIAMIIGASVANPSVLPAKLLISALFLLMNITLEPRMIGSWLERASSRSQALSGNILRGLYPIRRLGAIPQSAPSAVRPFGAALGQTIASLLVRFPAVACGANHSRCGTK